MNPLSPQDPPVGLVTMTPAMAETKNYYRWMADLMASAIGERILDVGGGRGSMLSRFLDRERLFALDISEDCVAYLRQLFDDQDHVEIRLGDVTDPRLVRHYRASGVDTILCTNVLEHVEDDAAMLRAFADILAPVGGRLALQVPSHPWLYGSLDEAAGHYRRYRRKELRRRLEEAGLRIDRIGFVNAAAIPGWWIAGRVRRQALDGEGTNRQVRFYDRWMIPVARALESVVRPPVGLSLIALASAVETAPQVEPVS